MYNGKSHHTLQSMTLEPPDLIQAIGWLRDVRNRAHQLEVQASEQLKSSRTSSKVATVLHAVLARCALELAQSPVAVDHARRAVMTDDGTLDAEVRAEMCGFCARAMYYAGYFDEAEALLDRYEGLLGDEARPLLDVSRAGLEYKRGNLVGTSFFAARAIDAMPPGRPLDLARAHNNRAVADLYLGDLSRCRADFDTAEELCLAHNQPSWAADIKHSRAMLLARLGELPTALRDFAEAEETLSGLGIPIEQHIVYRCEILSLCGLAEDVVESLPAAIDRLETQGMVADASEGRLYLAIALWSLNDARARDVAARAVEIFDDAGRSGWSAIARDLILDITISVDGPLAIDLNDARTLADRLERHGMRYFAAASWLRIAYAAHARGEGDSAVSALDRFTGLKDSLVLRLVAHEGQALRHVIRRELGQARKSIHAGRRLLHQHRRLFRATELRAQSAAWGAGLEALDIALAWEGPPRRLIETVERWRATATTADVTTHSAGDDHQLETLLGEYRIQQAALAAERRDGTGVSERESKVLRLERAISTELRTRSDHNNALVDEPVSLPRLYEHLGSTGLVEFVEHDGQLAAIVCAGRRSTLVRLGPTRHVEQLAATVRQGLRQLAALAEMRGGVLVARSVHAHTDMLTSAVALPILKAMRHIDSIVVIPSRSVHSLPWAYLFGPAVSVCVAPSATLWAGRDRPDQVSGAIHVVAGAGLTGADLEAACIARIHPSAQLLTSTRSSVAAVSEALKGSGLVHIAAHAKFRAANPLFSSLQLVDGPITAHDLDRLHAPADVIILSACSTAAISAQSGGAPLGLSSVLLSRGTRSLVVANSPLPDEAIVPMMERFHTRLRAGESVARGLVAAAESNDAASPLGLLERCAFSVFGRGDVCLAPEFIG